MENIVVVILIICVYKIQKNFVKNKYEKEKLNDFIKKIEAEYMEIQGFKHDYKNILISIGGYIEEHDLIGLEKFYHENIINTKKIDNMDIVNLSQIYKIKIPELRGLILGKVSLEDTSKIPIKIRCNDTIDYICMNRIKMVRCIGILIDNAVEAAVECEEPEVIINIIKERNEVNITVLNNFKQVDIKNIYKYGYSLKGVGRGVGLYNLRNILKTTSNVLVNTEIKDKYFKQEMIIQNSYSSNCLRVN